MLTFECAIVLNVASCSSACILLIVCDPHGVLLMAGRSALVLLWITLRNKLTALNFNICILTIDQVERLGNNININVYDLPNFQISWICISI